MAGLRQLRILRSKDWMMTELRHPRLAHALMALRPGSRSLKDFVCRDDADGKGPYLVDGSMINPPTQAEVDALTTEQLDQAAADKVASAIQLDDVVGKILFNHENRLRALEGKQALTKQQFRSAVRQLGL